MTALESPPRSGARLLAGAHVTANRPRLQLHLEIYGPLAPSPRGGRRSADQLLGAIEASGLTGRGGAAFPTGRKLATVGSLRRRPVVVVNVMEGEPASAKDRVLATSVPHLVLDGADALANALGAAAVRICVARPYGEAARSLEAALEERMIAGLATVPTVVDRPPGRYVAGEESALVHWLDGGESRPLFRAGRPAVPRLGGRPALVDNAETLAQVALIARHGAEWFRSVGLPEAPGTTLLTTSGALRRPGVVEVPLGTRLSAVLASAEAVQPLAGVLLGGYGGTFVAPSDLDVPLAPGPLASVGANLGTGVVVALPHSACGLAETARIVRWMAGESAGQCGPCAFGLPALAQDLDDLVAGRRGAEALHRLGFRLGEVDGRGACRHPDGVVRLVRSALGVFAGDVDHHARWGPCPGAAAPSSLVLPSPGDGEWL